MQHVFKLSSFVKPYWKQSLLALVLLTTLVFMDLSIPRLIQRIIDQGVQQQNQPVVIQTGLLMLGISLLSAFIAVGNNILSVRVGESVFLMEPRTPAHPATSARGVAFASARMTPANSSVSAK